MKTTQQYQEDLAMELSEEFTEQLVQNNIDLIEAIAEENYEKAAIIRDNIKVLIETITFNVTHILNINADVLKKHYNEQNEIAFKQLIKAFNG
jgi:hypothetical protein